MSNDNRSNHIVPTPLETALKGTGDTPQIIAAELRKMANGEGEYRRFLYTSKWVKNVWHAAADIIDKD